MDFEMLKIGIYLVGCFLGIYLVAKKFGNKK